jgi:predicted HAD superfamily phosphohydrolase YqeG
LEVWADMVVAHLQSVGVKVVVFDMDQTLVSQHSRGQMRREGPALAAFTDNVSRSFIVFSLRLHAAGFKLAVATHSGVSLLLLGA